MPVALITGAARGIGAATAGALAAGGWDLVLFDVCRDEPALGYRLASPEELEATARRCGGEAIVGDVRSADDLARAVERAVGRFGGLDAAVGAAGVLAAAGRAWEMPEEQWRTTLDINLSGIFNLARAAVPAMLARPAPRSGRFVAVSSAAALKATARLAAYSASKAGIIGFVRGLAADLADTGVTANAVLPGSTDTALLAHSAEIYGLDDPARLADHHVNHRIIRPEEVAAVAAWLCSEASGALTGAAVPADGGMTAR
ncbi:MAG: SDR family oxidoreductase [Acidimicrobiia bacterium]|nr:SDR family oxidoreductase [Acidimicrobiia bacterium]MYE67175.1 SDR family oxidoreductase [Acidimicrobiia bacterium]